MYRDARSTKQNFPRLFVYPSVRAYVKIREDLYEFLCQLHCVVLLKRVKLSVR